MEPGNGAPVRATCPIPVLHDRRTAHGRGVVWLEQTPNHNNPCRHLSHLPKSTLDDKSSGREPSRQSVRQLLCSALG